jgi:hypothetical protein
VKLLIALLAAAAVFAPAASADVGEDAGNTPKRADRGAAVRNTDPPPKTRVPSPPNTTTSPRGKLFQNPLIWVGSPNPDPPPQIVITEFEPLENVPAPLRGSFGWMKDFEFEACVLGLSSVTKGQNVVGPYGTATTAFSSSGCK